MRLVLRHDDQEVGRELKLSAPLPELKRRIQLTRTINPEAVLAYQLTQEVKFQLRWDELIGQLVQEIIQNLG